MQPFAQNTTPASRSTGGLPASEQPPSPSGLWIFSRVCKAFPLGKWLDSAPAPQSDGEDDAGADALSAPDPGWNTDAGSSPQWAELSEPPVDDSTRKKRKKPVAGRPRPRPIRDSGVKPAAYEAESDPAESGTDISDDSSPENGSQSEILNADFADTLQQSRTLLKSGQILDAHAQLSRLYWKYPAQRRAVPPRCSSKRLPKSSSLRKVSSANRTWLNTEKLWKVLVASTKFRGDISQNSTASHPQNFRLARN
ncbi:MAG UNVERIFIED_CONTAM: hypothetical protein LVR18_27045 [Planctomycetaceae bacterium]|jgi:hypothetical protein